jgi:formamidopyrimidine-DNA glycosylase
MPELPEVETVRRSLLPHVLGRRIRGLRLGDFPGVLGGDSAEMVAARITGRAITAIDRRAKYLLFGLDDDSTLMIHLRMTGQLSVVPRSNPRLRFEHLAIELDDGNDLRFADQRKFGRVLHLLPADVSALDLRLGPEPLSSTFSAEFLAASLARRPGKVKSVLLDQKLVAGLGNIYVDEALFRAQIHPERSARTLTLDEVRRLHRAIRAVLRDSLDYRGTTFSSFQDANGESGGYGAVLSVYGRGGTGPCPRCHRPLAKIIVGGRGTHFCPRCQQLDPAPGNTTGKATPRAAVAGERGVSPAITPVSRAE